MNGLSIRVEGISKHFGSFSALEDVSLEIKAGEFFSLLGPSGCGKTTLLRIIGGFEQPSAGRLLLGGEDASNLSSHQRHVNTVFQSYALFPHLSIFENVAFALRLKKGEQKRTETQIQSEVKEFLALVQMETHLEKFPAQLSGGQKQRVAIARALINQPGVLLLDEPLSALDAKLREKMLMELDRIHDQVGITFILVTHDQEEALGVSDRIAVMNKGKVLQVGSPSKIYESPASSFVADFIGESNLFEGEVLSTEGNFAKVNVEGFGEMLCEQDQPLIKGSHIKFTLRPEKIFIRKDVPENWSGKTLSPLYQGKVEEIIYSGFQSKYFISTESGQKVRIFKQHESFFEDKDAIAWGHTVYFGYDAHDSFVVESHH